MHVPPLDGVLAAATRRQPALPIDYLTDPRLHFVAINQLQRTVSAALLERGLPGEESQFRREARTVWAIVSFAERFGVDLEPLLAAVGPPPDDGEHEVILLNEPQAAGPTAESAAPAAPTHLDEGNTALAMAGILLGEAVEQRLRERRAPHLTREIALGLLPVDGQLLRTSGSTASKVVSGMEWTAAEIAAGRAEPRAQAQQQAVVTRARLDEVQPALFNLNPEEVAHARRKAHAKRMRDARYERERVREARAEERRTSREAVRAERAAKNLAGDQDVDKGETRLEQIRRIRRRPRNRCDNTVVRGEGKGDHIGRRS